MSTSIIIGDTTIHQDAHGLFSLNDLHRASGGESRHQPAFFMRRKETEEILAVLNSANPQSILVVTAEGRNGGTFACKSLVYDYAMWISAEFRERVIRIFDAVATGHTLPQPVSAAPRLPAGPLQDKVTAHFAVLECMRAIPGVNAGIAGAVVLDAIHVDTGLTMEPYRKLLPAADGPTPTLNATRVGEALGMSARKANKALEAAGLQRKNQRGEWELTEAGAKYGEMVPYSNNGHAGYQPLWKPAVLEVLRGGTP
jgi:hypothetical protein